MKKSNLRIFVLSVAAFLMPVSGISQTRDYRGFIYNGIVEDFKGAAWNPQAPYSPGFYLAFYGDADPSAACPSVTNGPVVSTVSWTNLVADTGISDGGVGTVFSPVSVYPTCGSTGWQGYSHAHYKNGSDYLSPGGVGLYTHTGPKPGDSSLSFFQPYRLSGTGNTAGSNNHIQGNFSIFTCANQCGAVPTPLYVTYPFSGGSNDPNVKRVAIVSYQGVVKMGMDYPSGQQIKQQIALNFMSRQNFKEIQYLFVTAISGVNLPLISDSMVMVDVSQGGTVAIIGSIGAVGQSTMGKDAFGNSYQLWTSWASPTQNNTWVGQKKFQTEISFLQFKSAMRLAVAAIDKSNAANVSDEDIKRVYGINALDPLNWIVGSNGVSQEVSNPFWASSRAHIGGNFTELQVLSLPF